jgi:uncharacterized protein YoxC
MDIGLSNGEEKAQPPPRRRDDPDDHDWNDRRGAVMIHNSNPGDGNGNGYRRNVQIASYAAAAAIIGALVGISTLMLSPINQDVTDNSQRITRNEDRIERDFRAVRENILGKEAFERFDRDIQRRLDALERHIENSDKNLNVIISEHRELHAEVNALQSQIDELRRTQAPTVRGFPDQR